MVSTITKTNNVKYLAWHGWIGLGLVASFWLINWSFQGARSHWAFFPLWLGYCLTIDALVLLRKKTSLLTRNWRKYVGLFLISTPAWWVFEVLNWRLNNWIYIGRDEFSSVNFWLWASLSFSTVVPAVFGTAELIGSLNFLKHPWHGLVIGTKIGTTLPFFISGLIMFTMMMLKPSHLFPFLWLSIFFILEPINIWLGNHSLTVWIRNGDWRPVVALCIGGLMTGFFWEMWNYFSYPKWVYQISWGYWGKIFEMPLLGYIGYLPFSLELYAVYHLVEGFLGRKDTRYLQVISET